MKKIINLSLVLCFALLLSACNTPLTMQKQSSDGSESKMETNSVNSGETEISPTPTVSKDDSVDSIEADLNSTVILQEDFSDIK